MNNSVFTENDLLLLREASLSSMAIGTGLTYIGRYDFTQYGYFYSGLQSICVGLERLLKLIWVYDYRLSNADCFPKNKDLIQFSHNLEKLFSQARAINLKHSLGIEDAFLDNDVIFKRIISLMTDYALTDRYYNLDYLSGRQKTGIEPLRRWDQEIGSEVVNRHYSQSIDDRQKMRDIATLLESFAITRFTNENGDEIITAYDQLAESDLSITKQLYSKFYLFIIVRFLTRIFVELEYKGRYFPFLREFFTIFLAEDEGQILAKTSWNPIPPYHFNETS